jgi:hypothetical protein
MCSYNGLKNIQPTNVHRENLIKFILTQYNKTSLLKRKEKEGSDKKKSIFFHTDWIFLSKHKCIVVQWKAEYVSIWFLATVSQLKRIFWAAQINFQTSIPCFISIENSRFEFFASNKMTSILLTSSPSSQASKRIRHRSITLFYLKHAELQTYRNLRIATRRRTECMRSWRQTITWLRNMSQSTHNCIAKGKWKYNGTMTETEMRKSETAC